MPAHDLVQAGFQRCDIQLAYQTRSAADIVKGVARIQLLEQPKPFLGKG